VFVRGSIGFSSIKANSSSGSVRLIPRARFGFAVRFAFLGKYRSFRRAQLRPFSNQRLVPPRRATARPTLVPTRLRRAATSPRRVVTSEDFLIPWSLPPRSLPFRPSLRRTRPGLLLPTAALMRYAARHISLVGPYLRRPPLLRVRLSRRRRRSGERRKARWPTPGLSCPTTKTGTSSLQNTALPPRLGGLLAPARSFERLESS
jgi:hypothetical protein